MSVSVPGAFGNGTLAVTSYLGHRMDETECRKLFANFLVYGRYGVFYLDYGSPQPVGRSVSSAQRPVFAMLPGEDAGVDILAVLQLWGG